MRKYTFLNRTVLLCTALLAAGWFLFGKTSGEAAAQTGRHTVEVKIDKTEDFDDWRLQCGKNGQGVRQCILFQQLSVKDDAREKFLLLASIILTPSGADKTAPARPYLRLATPPGVHIPTGITANIDAGKSFKIPFETCAITKCFAEGPIGEDILTRMRDGEAMAVSFRLQRAKPVMVHVSLKGFSAALRALQVETAP